jgi:hypothetical protein
MMTAPSDAGNSAIVLYAYNAQPAGACDTGATKATRYCVVAPKEDCAMTDPDDTPEDPHPEKLDLELPRGLLGHIDAVLEPGESREDFVREAVVEKLRDRLQKRPGNGLTLEQLAKEKLGS